LSESRTPNKIQLNYVSCGKELLTMITEGTFPDYSSPTGRRRGAPRANDGLLRLDVDGNVSFASPNGLSAFSRLGIEGEIEGKSLAEVATKIVKEQSTVDESLPLVLTGKAPWRADLESKEVTLSVRAIPLMKAGARTGAIVLCREITELRRQEQQLLTKDATIREIHHRVKNNLQTVASLMRIQMRRTTSDDAKEALEQAIRRVSAIALVHNTLAEGFSDEVNFDEVFESSMRLVGELATDSSREIKLRIDGKFGQLDSGLATPLAVALTEIVTNAASHGLGEHGGTILITARQTAKQLTIEVEDAVASHEGWIAEGRVQGPEGKIRGSGERNAQTRVGHPALRAGDQGPIGSLQTDHSSPAVMRGHQIMLRGDKSEALGPVRCRPADPRPIITGADEADVGIGHRIGGKPARETVVDRTAVVGHLQRPEISSQEPKQPQGDHCPFISARVQLG
jgi:two-component sensor histidine kinase